MNVLALLADTAATIPPVADSPLPELGAAAFGAIVGWYVYYINRYRRGDVQLSDLVTLIGILGGAGILKLFPEGSSLFGAYGLGLFGGFFAYFVTLLFCVSKSKNFTIDWFLDGRRSRPAETEYIPDELAAGGGGRPMAVNPGAGGPPGGEAPRGPKG